MATFKIADAIARHEGRVIIFSSNDSDDVVSDAENALQRIATLILKDYDSNVVASKVTAGHMATNTTGVLVAGSQAGCLIGMSCQNTVKLRNSSSATVVVLAPNQLHLFASAHESHLVVLISGDVPVVLKALVEIGYQLRTTNLAAEYITFEMMILVTLISGLIGRCGSSISRIRNESAAMIKGCLSVYSGKGEQ